MKVTRQQIIEAAHKVGFTGEDSWLIYADTIFDGEIGVEEYACGERILKLLLELGLEIEDHEM